MRLWTLLVLLGSVACGASANPEQKRGASTPLGVRVVDSTWITPWDEVVDSLLVYRVAIGSADTVGDVTMPSPLLVGDSIAWGLQADRGAKDRRFFRLNLPAHRVDVWPLPREVLGGFTDVMVSPDGAYVAYVALDSAGRPFARIRALPAGPVLMDGPPAGGCDCDVDLSHARWVTADSFEVAVISSTDNRGWSISTGDVRSRRIHTVFQATEPDWHARLP